MTSPYVCILKSLPLKADCSVALGRSFLQCWGHSTICLLHMREEMEKFGTSSLFLIYLGGFVFNNYNLEPYQMCLLSSGDLVRSINNPNSGFPEEGGAIILEWQEMRSH